MANLGKFEAKISADTTKFRKELKGAQKSTGGLKGGVKDLTSAVSALDGPFGGISSRMSAFTSLASSGTLATTAFAIGITALGAATIATARHMAEVEVGQAKTNAILRATGSAAGLTSNQLDMMARKLALSTLASTEGVRDAQNVLLTFKSIAGDTFGRTLTLAQDMAATFGGDLKSSTTQLGKALEDPVKGLSALARVGVTFNEQQQNQIKTMVKMGDTAKAQTLILNTLESQIGGSGRAEAGGVTGAVDTLGQRWNDLLEAWDKTTGTAKKATTSLNLISRALHGLSAAMNPTNEERVNQLVVKRFELMGKIKKLNDDGFKKWGWDGNSFREYTAELEKVNKEIGEIQNKRIEEQKAESKLALKAEKKRQQNALNTRIGLLKKETSLIGLSLQDKLGKENAYFEKRKEALTTLAQLDETSRKTVNQILEQEEKRHTDAVMAIRDKPAAEQRKRLTTSLAAITRSFQTKTEKETLFQAQRRGIINQSFNLELISETEKNRLLEAEYRRSKGVLASIDAEALAKKRADRTKKLLEQTAPSQALTASVFSDIEGQQSPIEKENQQYQARLERFKTFTEQNTELRGFMNQKVQAEEERHSKVMSNLARQEQHQKLGYVQTGLNGMATLMNTGNKKLFKIGKVAAISSALIDGYKAVQNALANVPYPFNIAAAAGMAVSTAVNVANIKKQKFGGGGTISASTSGGAMPNVYQPPQPTIPATTPIESQQRGVQIIFNGPVNGNAELIAETLKEHLDKTDFVLIEPQSRNGQALAA